MRSQQVTKTEDKKRMASRRKIESPALDNIDHEQVANLYCNELMSIRRISKIFNTSTTTIARILRKNKIKIRTRGEAQKIRWSKSKNISDECKIKAVNEYVENGLSIGDVSEKLRISRKKVRKALEEFDVEIRKSKMPEWHNLPQESIIRTYTEEKLSVSETARKHNTTDSLVMKVLKENNISRRTLSEAKKESHRNKKIRMEKACEAEIIKIDKDVKSKKNISTEEKIKYLRNEKNAKIQDIALTLNISTVDVHNALLQMGEI